MTSDPLRISVTINKANYSCSTIKTTKKLNINVIDVTASFEIFKKYGFVSGKDKSKFEGESLRKSSNGLVVLSNNINSYMSLEVVEMVDLETHVMFICKVVESKVLNNNLTMTYDYYQTNVKPKNDETKKKGYVCKICGYVYEGDEISEDFICPLCKHGASDFEKIE